MKSFKRITMIAIAIFFTALLCNLFGWGDDDVVNQYDYQARTSPNNVWCVAACKDTAHAVWYYYFSSGDDQVWYARSSDNTETWSGHTELSSGIDGEDNYPSIAIVGDTVHVAWLNTNGSNYAILYRRSTNKGASWGSVDTISDAMDDKTEAPCIRASGSNVYVAWRDQEDADPYYDIFFDRSTNNGSTWGTDQNLSIVSGSDNSRYPSVAVIGDTVDVVWEHHDPGFPGDYEIYHKRNDNSGGSRDWSGIHNITYNPDSSQQYPCVVNESGYINVVWEQLNKIWSSRSTNGGSNWTQRQVQDTTSYQHHPNVAVTDANVHVVWEDSRDSFINIYHACSFNNGYSWDDHERVSADNNYVSNFASIGAIIDNQDSDYRNLYVLWWENFASHPDVLADYDQYEYEVEMEPGQGGGELISGAISHENEILNMQIFPNPMNSQATVKYTLSNPRFMRIAVYDASGRFIKTLFEGEQNPGSHLLEWDGKNAGGGELNPGVYFIKAKGFEDTKVIKLR